MRKTLHPGEGPMVSHGTTQYRGVTMWPPFLTGASMAYVGTYETGKLVVYPIRKELDECGRRLTNWVVETAKVSTEEPDWTRPADAEAFAGALDGWSFDWLDIPAMIRAADTILEYPVVDREPLPWWTQGRITLLGDAAHPMLPRGSNGAAQAMLDGQALARVLAGAADRPAALHAYERRTPPRQRSALSSQIAPRIPTPFCASFKNEPAASRSLTSTMSSRAMSAISGNRAIGKLPASNEIHPNRRYRSSSHADRSREY